MSARFPAPSRVVVKVGSSSLRAVDGGLDGALVADLVRQIAGLREQRVEVVLVSSGAVAAGVGPLGLPARPQSLPALQAAASVGQGVLVHTYQSAFAVHGLVSGQVLLTPDDVVVRARYLNARNTFEKLLELGAVPVVNENDTVVTDELRFGDNDRLAALAASMLGAQVLVLLSDVDGLLDGDPTAGSELAVVDRVDDIAALDARLFGGVGSEVGRGGMATKLEAARIMAFSGGHAVIANARQPDVIAAAVSGEHLGTWFPPARRRPESRKLWIAFAPIPRGTVVVDEGAVRALVDRGSSLLAAGIVDALGDFTAGDAVNVVGPGQRVVARGLIAYSKEDVVRLRGRSSEALAAELGAPYAREVIHRDSLVVIA